MSDPLLHPISGRTEPTQSWLSRVLENLAQVLISTPLKASSANGAPIHLLKLDKSPRPARAQGASLITHATVFAALAFLLANSRKGPTPPPVNGATSLNQVSFPTALFRSLTSEHPSGGSGSGGDQNPLPATPGNLPPHSSLVLVKPTLPQEQHLVLPEPPTIFDVNAAPVLTTTVKLGLPWMTTETDSGGPGKGPSIGSEDGNSVGDGGAGPAGDGTGTGPYVPGLIPPGCAYCPIPDLYG